MAEPILVLQMQRMGDLILSFPLLLWLSRCYPGRPIRVVAEEAFSTPLLPLSPHAGYLSWREAEAGALDGRRQHLLVNLSIREEAARLAGRLEADIKIGPVREADGTLRVRGGWQLYRASLVRMGRHNRFHWADLNALDLIDPEAMRLTDFAPPRAPRPGRHAVGLFIGASEAAKRPDAAFWAGLARAVLDRGLKPVLLGGPGDRPLARAVREASGLDLASLVGQLSLAEFSEFGRELDLMITPDTGPMHLAAWTGLPVLNLSVGPVNPWDTGPYQPGHLVLRSRASCARGCWDCPRGGSACRRGLEPGPVAALAALFVRGGRDRIANMRLPGLELFESARTPEGLCRLRRLGPRDESGGPGGAAAADLAGEFWRRYFWCRLLGRPMDPARQAWQELALAFPELAERLPRFLPALGRGVAQLATRANGSGGGDGLDALSRAAPPFWRLLASQLEMAGHNEDLSAQWAGRSLDELAALAGLLR